MKRHIVIGDNIECCRCKKAYPATLEYFSKDKNKKNGLTSQCKDCRSAMWKQQYSNNKDYHVSRATNRVKILRLTDAAYREKERLYGRAKKQELLSTREGREHHNALGRKWRKENPEKARQLKHEQKEFKCARSMARYARQRSALPKWSDLDSIKVFYEEAKRITLETGIAHEVDHIIPLAGLNVSGLHVPQNLQVIPAHINRRKGNRLEF